MNAEKYGLDRIYFGGCFIRGKQTNFVVFLDRLVGRSSRFASQAMPQQFRVSRMPFDFGVEEP